MTLRIQRLPQEGAVVFALSGRIDGEQVEDLQSVFAAERDRHRIVLNLEHVDLVDQDAVRFLSRCVADGITLERCPAYIREWIGREEVDR
jgi:anti-anti-sigma regulatory factor